MPALSRWWLQNRCPLPYRGEHEGGQKVVLSKRVPWPSYPSLLVLPLVIHDRALGTLILGAKRRHAFGDSVRPTLEVLASHLAVSLSNARMVHKLETMATTDGLTSLFNKRAMLDAAAQKIAAATRFGRKLSVLVVDIDHFKRVNDTHGHDVGDVVIRGLGDVLKRQKRSTDVVARFGGEEFVVLREQTDEKGAMLLAERIRDELGKTLFRAPNGVVSVTCPWVSRPFRKPAVTGNRFSRRPMTPCTCRNVPAAIARRPGGHTARPRRPDEGRRRGSRQGDRPWQH